MPCKRGQADPDRHTILRLFADSGGYCQCPDCSNRLFLDTGTKNIHIAEAAHIIAASAKGPRSSSKLTSAQKGSYENLILLCVTCHTIIDKAPKDFPDLVVREWKRKHVERIRLLFGAIEYPKRTAARQAIEPALMENRAIFDRFGPNNSYRDDPESELAKVWQRKMRSIVLPNNRKILAVIDANRRHLRQGELETLEAFRQHVDDLETKHIANRVGEVASQFPDSMGTILSDG